MDDRNPKRAKAYAPKKSAFERHKDELEAKRIQDQADTDAALDDFTKYFDVESPTDTRPPSGGYNRPPPRSNVPGQRHFASNALRMSGPGTLQPPSSDYPSRKRTHEGFVPQLSRHSMPEQPRPSLLMISLPPGSSVSFVKSLVPSLRVDNVKIFPPDRPHPSNKKSLSAIVSLVSDTLTSDLDSVSSALQNKYLGRGYHLSVSRHLSSSSVRSTLDLHSTPSLPFGAKEKEPQSSYESGYGSSRAPPRGFPPQTSYGPNSGRRDPSSVVEVKIPQDIKQLQIIHKTIENVLKHGPGFEALLMSRSDIKTDEKWAWLYDARSAEGVYYRWRLHQTVTNSGAHFSKLARSQTSNSIFAGEAEWLSPEGSLEYEFTTDIAEFISDKDYDSSDEDDLDGEESMPKFAGTAQKGDPAPGYNQWIGPLGKAKLTHLLARLPTSHTRLRRGDVARITAFAIEHARDGAAEIVNMILFNLRSPFAFTGANPGRLIKDNDSVKDVSPAKLVGLYIISDIISSCATSGIRHAWRYRTLFEAGLRENKVFEHLGRLSKDLKWGRLRSENWKRSIQGILRMWDDSSAFTHTNHAYFVDTFNNPPLTEDEQRELDEANKAAELEKSLSYTKGRFITTGFKPATGRVTVIHANMSYSGGLGVKGDEGIPLTLDDLSMEVSTNIDCTS